MAISTVQGGPNAYETVAITQYLQDGITAGTVNWTVRNLNIDRLIDGTLIPEIQDNTEWVNAFTTPAWCYYNNDPANGPIYGKLYNRAAYASGLLTIPGFRIPTENDYFGLFNYYIYPAYDSSYFREAGYEHWNTSYVPGLDGIGFKALGGGYRNQSDGTFSSFKDVASFGSYEANKEFTIDNQGDPATVFTSDFRGTSIRLIKI